MPPACSWLADRAWKSFQVPLTCAQLESLRMTSIGGILMIPVRATTGPCASAFCNFDRSLVRPCETCTLAAGLVLQVGVDWTDFRHHPRLAAAQLRPTGVSLATALAGAIIIWPGLPGRAPFAPEHFVVCACGRRGLAHWRAKRIRPRRWPHWSAVGAGTGAAGWFNSLRAPRSVLPIRNRIRAGRDLGGTRRGMTSRSWPQPQQVHSL